MKRRTRRAILTVIAASVLGGGGLSIPSFFADALPAVTGPIADALNGLTTRDPDAGIPRYTRAAFGQAWSDDVTVAGGHDGCDTRNQILHRDAVSGSLTIKPGTRGCKVLAGKWISPYTGQTITDRSKTAIDHIVPLAEAWVSGAYRWNDDQRRNYANDPVVLLTVDARSNQVKGADTPDEWLPAQGECDYARRWVTIKVRYSLSTTTAEKVAITKALATCL